ncbi:MAG: ABC transporter substrate-binding protein, partial [Pseudomonadota bacterium]
IAVLASVGLAFLMLGQAEAQNRIVSVGGDVTEIVYALGAGDQVIATDSTSVYPPEAAQTPKVGYVRQLSAEGVLSLEPDLILISGAAGPDTALEQIRASGVPVVQMETAYTVDSIIDKTNRIAEALGRDAEGDALAAEISASWGMSKQQVATADLSPRVLFFATFADSAPRAAGAETAAQGVIDLIGGENVFADQTGYKSLSFEAAVAADPDIILVMDQNVIRAGGLEALTSHPAVSLTTAVQTGRVFIVDAVRIMQFGPRTPEAVSQLANEISEGLSGEG